MHKALIDERLAVAPKFNERICEGIAVHDIGKAMRYIDDTAKSAAVGFPRQIEYAGMRRMSPEEHHRETFGQKDKKKRTFALATTDLYPVEMRFTYDAGNGTPKQSIKRMVYLPYVGQGGILRISGSKRVIHPVLADTVFTATATDLFVILARAALRLNVTTMLSWRTGDVPVATTFSGKSTTDKRRQAGMTRCHVVQ